MSSEMLAILLLAVVHVAAVVVLLGVALRDEGFRGWWPREDSGDDGGSRPQDGPRGGGPPLADAELTTLRLRGPGRLADARRRRRARSSEPKPAPAPSRDDVPARRASIS